MGASGIGNFENDDASDWIYELEESSGFELLKATLQEVLDTAEELESPICCQALAAAEVVAALGGLPGELPEEVVEWIKKADRPKDDQLKKLATQAVQRIALSSELKELWEESGDVESWMEQVQELLKRLK